MFSFFGFGKLAIGQSPGPFAGCVKTFQSYATSNPIRWFSVFNFIENIKQAGDGILSCASLCQNYHNMV